MFLFSAEGGPFPPCGGISASFLFLWGAFLDLPPRPYKISADAMGGGQLKKVHEKGPPMWRKKNIRRKNLRSKEKKQAQKMPHNKGKKNPQYIEKRPP